MKPAAARTRIEALANMMLILNWCIIDTVERWFVNFLLVGMKKVKKGDKKAVYIPFYHIV